MKQHNIEVLEGKRFEFGKNWQDYLNTLTAERIQQASTALCKALGVDNLVGKTFLDIGSGSGLSSLVARQLGAKVVSFDYDNYSVLATRRIKDLYFKNDPNWQIHEGSVLDREFLKSLGEFDIVYSWGVLHHTGDMYTAFKNITTNLKPNSLLFIAIYNDQGWISSYWKLLKKLYCKVPVLRPIIKLWHLPYPLGAVVLYRLITGRLKDLGRGMSLWHDYIDWIGGYPFEVASVEAVVDFFALRNLQLQHLKDTKRGGCNEFVFSLKSID